MLNIFLLFTIYGFVCGWAGVIAALLIWDSASIVANVANVYWWMVVQAVQEQVTSAVQEIGHLIEPISTAARGEAAQLGHKVTQAYTHTH